MGVNFIGPDELSGIAGKMNIPDARTLGNIPPIPYREDDVAAVRSTHLMILGAPKAADGTPLTLVKMRAHLGWDPATSEPCFYNQDWYLKEKFANETTLEPRWYLVRKEVVEATRGKTVDAGKDALAEHEQLPSAMVTAYAFFAYYFLTGGQLLWKNDFIWCADTDANGDRIYTGRYVDPKGVNKNGFNIHRHLSVRPCYGIAPVR